MNSSQDTVIDPAQYARMMWRRKGVIVLCAVTVLSAAMIGLEFIPDEYESEATLMIEDRQRLASQLRSVIGGMRPSEGYGADEKRMDKLVGRVRSRPFLERVTRLLRLHEDPSIREEAIRELEERPDLDIEEMATRIVVGKVREKISFANSGSGIYKIIVADQDPRNAQLLAKWVSEVFVDVSAQGAIDDLKAAHKFGTEQLKIYEEQLRASERALEQYKASAIQQDLSKGIVRAANVNLAEALYRRVLDEADLARMRILPFSRALSATDLQSEGSVMLGQPRIKNQGLALATSLREEVSNRLLGDGRQVGEWPPQGSYASLRRGLLQLVERTVESEFQQAVPDARDALGRFVFTTLDHEAHADAAEYLGQAISEYKRNAQSEPRGQMELARLEAEVETNRLLLGSFQAQLVASDVSQAAETTNLGMRIEILDPPQTPLAPVRPARGKILFAAILMGPLLGVGVAFLTELLDPTLRALSDFQRHFSGPVLGTTPLVTRGLPRPGRLRRLWIPAALTGVVLLTLTFFLTKDTLIGGSGVVAKPLQVIDPEATTQP